VKTIKQIINRLDRAIGATGQGMDRMHLNDKNSKNRETAIRIVTRQDTEIEVLKWVLTDYEDRPEI